MQVDLRFSEFQKVQWIAEKRYLQLKVGLKQFIESSFLVSFPTKGQKTVETFPNDYEANTGHSLDSSTSSSANAMHLYYFAISQAWKHRLLLHWASSPSLTLAALTRFCCRSCVLCLFSPAICVFLLCSFPACITGSGALTYNMHLMASPPDQFCIAVFVFSLSFAPCGEADSHPVISCLLTENYWVSPYNSISS